MRLGPGFLLLLLIVSTLGSCGKEGNQKDCSQKGPYLRLIKNKKAIVKLTATIDPVYLVEEGAIDTRLVPCNFPLDFYQNDLQVTISGEVRANEKAGSVPCCVETLVITKISR